MEQEVAFPVPSLALAAPRARTLVHTKGKNKHKRGDRSLLFPFALL